MLCLAPGDTYTLTWSIYRTRTDNYWDFINTVRQDWGVNRTVPGSYVWFAPDQVLSMSPAQLHKALGLQKVAIASMYGGWVDPMRQAEPPLIGFGTFVMSGEFTNFRTRIRDAIDRIKHARPGIAALAYFNSQRDSTPDAPARYGDSLLTQQGATPEHTDWGGRYSTTWSMVPTDSNTFGRAMQSVAKASRDLGADGLYWDEMDGVDYRAPRITTSRWDHHTCLLTDQGDVKAEVGLANLLSESVKLDYAGTGLILGNTPPTTRHFQERPDIRIVEAHHQERWGAFAHLTTPLGYIGTERKDWAMVLERLDEPLLIAGTQFDYPFDLIARMFPFTPDYIQSGTLRGRERIITSRSGTHGWPGYSGPIRGFRYDRWGKEHEASWHTKSRPDGVRVRVRLRPGEAAIIERDG